MNTADGDKIPFKLELKDPLFCLLFFCLPGFIYFIWEVSLYMHDESGPIGLLIAWAGLSILWMAEKFISPRILRLEFISPATLQRKIPPGFTVKFLIESGVWLALSILAGGFIGFWQVADLYSHMSAITQSFFDWLIL